MTEKNPLLHVSASAGATRNCKETGCDPFQKLFDSEPLYLYKYKNGSIAVFLLSLAASFKGYTQAYCAVPFQFLSFLSVYTGWLF